MITKQKEKGRRTMINYVNESPHDQLTLGSEHAAGYDIRAFIDEAYVTLEPGERAVIHTGLYVELPNDIEMQIRPRSGLALKGLSVANSPGTVDADYRGEVGVILMNNATEPFTIHDGDRIAQAVFNKVEHLPMQEVALLSKTERGAGGFGHTGVK